MQVQNGGNPSFLTPSQPKPDHLTEAQIEKGYQLIKEKKYHAVLSLCVGPASNRDPEAMYLLAQMNIAVHHDTKDFDRQFTTVILPKLRKAAEYGHIKAAYVVGMYYHGKGEHKTARDYFMQLASLNSNQLTPLQPSELTEIHRILQAQC